MISWMIKKLFSKDVYVQFWADRISVSLIETKEVFDEASALATETVKGQDVVRAVGDGAEVLVNDGRYNVYHPFSHPRTLIRNFIQAEKVLQHAFQMVSKNHWFISMSVVIHPKEKLEGGLTGIECRALRELALGAGATEAILHVGQDLSIYDFDLKYVQEPEEI